MGIRKRWLCFILYSASFSQLQAQDADSLFRFPNDTILTYSDSLNIFYLIDSLLSATESDASSKLAIRLNYNSNVLSAGRTLGIDQFGLSPGISLYHKTGLYGDVSGYWSNDFDPKFYLMVLSAGYMHSFSSNFSLNVGYDRYFTINNNFLPYKNTLTVTPYLDLKPISISVNYAYYFSEGSAHRIMPSLNVTLEKRRVFKIDKIILAPSIYVLFGNQSWEEFEIIDPITRFERLQNYARYGTPYKIEVTKKSVFGTMNYAYSLPLSATIKNWNFSICYTYTIPIALPGESLLLSKSGFLAAGITYYISLLKE